MIRNYYNKCCYCYVLRSFRKRQRRKTSAVEALVSNGESRFVIFRARDVSSAATCKSRPVWARGFNFLNTKKEGASKPTVRSPAFGLY